jgi:endonuclease/exonuclease/phosphatase family metal-dependent hydrolase
MSWVLFLLQVPISCLQWEHRLPLILQEVREANADIICLQELNHFGKPGAYQTQGDQTAVAVQQAACMFPLSSCMPCFAQASSGS